MIDMMGYQKLSKVRTFKNMRKRIVSGKSLCCMLINRDGWMQNGTYSNQVRIVTVLFDGWPKMNTKKRLST